MTNGNGAAAEKISHEAGVDLKALSHPRIATVVALARRPQVQRFAKLAIIALVLLFLGDALRLSWAKIAGHYWQINWLIMVLGFLLLLSQELSFGLIWQFILRRMSYILPWRVCLRIYLAAEFVRYIPGNVWHVLTRIVWAEREGVPKSYGLASMTVELATRIAAGALLFVVSLLWWPDLTSLGNISRFGSLAIAILGIPLLLLGLQPRILQWGLNLALRVLKRAPITLTLTYRDILSITTAWCGSWLIGGLGFWLVVWAVTPGGLSWQAAIICVGVYALGWDIGFLSFITPSGLFFREGAVALLLFTAGVIPDLAIAGIIAILASRIVPTIAEVLCVGWAYWVTRQLPATQQPASPTLPVSLLEQGNIRVRATKVKR